MGFIRRLKIIRAFMKNHFVEALMSLLKEYKKMGERERLALEYEPITTLLDRLIPIYALSNEEFLQLYAVRYGGLELTPKKKRYLSDCIDELQDYGAFFRDSLNFKYAILCVKAQQRIFALCGDSDIDSLWITYITGIALYTRLYDFTNLFSLCGEGLKTAREHRDRALEFNILVREWAQCYLAALEDPSLDIDVAQLNIEEQLLELFTPYDNDARKFVKALEDLEMKKLEEVGPSGIVAYKIRTGLTEEALACYEMMLSIGQEDSEAINFQLNQIRKIEKDTYGEESLSDHRQDISLIGNIQGELPQELLRIVFQGSPESADPKQVFPEGMDPMERFFKLVFYAGKLSEMGYKGNAIAFYEEAKNMTEGFGEPFLNAMVLVSKARITQNDNMEQSMREKEEALTLLDQAEALGNSFAMVHYLRYTLRTERGGLLMEEHPQLAIEELSKAMAHLEALSLGQTLRLSQLLNLRGMAYVQANDQTAAERDWVQSLSIVQDDIRHRLPFMNAEKRELYWKKVSVALLETMLFVNSDSSDELKRMAYQTVLLYKGLLLSSERTVKNVIELDDSMAELRPIYKELQEKEAVRKYKDDGADEAAHEYSNQYIQKVRLTQALNNVIETHCDYLFETFEKVQARVSPNQILIDFFDYELDDGDQQYVAFVITACSQAPMLIKLCKESEINTIFEEARKEDSLMEAYNPRNKYAFELTKILWMPIENIAQITPNNEIFIVPSGSLAKIPIESLPIAEGQDKVLTEHFQKFVRLSHARVMSIEESDEWNSIVLYGGLEYGTGSKNVDETSKLRGYKIETSCSEPTRLRGWNYLKGTELEVTTIASQMQEACKKVQVFKGKEGSVSSFKALSGHVPDIIHIASHGFFETRKTAIELPALQSDNPMSLSGLVLSDGNKGWLHGTPQQHEGIITASEISRLQLPCQLVVLSACETGEGIVKSDGVYGLQRGFKKAGAKSLIMSLWGLEDIGGQAFMKLFYGKLAAGADRYHAFYDAKHELKKLFPNFPIIWAGMIMLD